MKKKCGLFLTVLLAFTLMIGFNTISVAAEGDVPEGAITNLDPDIYQCLKSQGFDKEEDGYITKDELDAAGETLDLCACGCKTLNGLENLQGHMKFLNLGQNKITDLSPIADVDIDFLILTGNKELSDISPIIDNNISRLVMGETQVSDEDKLKFLKIPDEIAASGQYSVKLAPDDLYQIEALEAAGESLVDNSDQVDTYFEQYVPGYYSLTLVIDATRLEEEQDVDISFDLLGHTYNIVVHAIPVKNDIVTFADENLKNALTFNPQTQPSDATDLRPVGVLIDTNSDGLITKTELKALTRLNMNLSSYPVSDFSGLESATNLETLIIKNNQPKAAVDWSAVGQLANVKDLDLDNNNLKDISFVKGLHKLISMRVNNSAVEDASPVSTLTSLEVLDLCNNNISECPDLSKLEQLHVRQTGVNNWIFTLNQIPAAQFTEAKFAPAIWAEIQNIGMDRWIAMNAYDNAEVTVPDPVLKEKMDVNGDGTVTKSEALSLTDIYLAHTDLTSLEGLEAAKNLVSLNVSITRISDLTPITELTELQNLTATDCAITDIPSLVKLTKLQLRYHVADEATYYTSKIFTGNKGLTVDELTKEKFAPNLQKYVTAEWIRDNAYDSTPVVFKSQEVKKAILDAYPKIDTDANGNITRTGMLDVKELYVCPERFGPMAPENPYPMVSLKGVEYAANLTSLEVRYVTKLTDVSAVSELTKLTNIRTASCQLKDSDLNYFKNLTNLTRLDISDNGLTDLSALAGLWKLNVLKLANNQLQDSQLTYLSKFSALDELDISGNQLTDLSGLSGLKGMRYFSASDNDITNADVVAEFSELSSLDLQNNRLTTIVPLKKLVHLYFAYAPGAFVYPFLGNKIPMSVFVGENGEDLIIAEEAFRYMSVTKEEWYANNTYVDKKVTFKDANLKAALVARGFDENKDGKISENELNTGIFERKELNLSHSAEDAWGKITDLSGLACITEETYNVDLSGNDITDLSQLSKVQIKDSLKLKDNSSLSSLTPIEGRKFKAVNLEGTAITSVEKRKLLNIPTEAIQATDSCEIQIAPDGLLNQDEKAAVTVSGDSTVPCTVDNANGCVVKVDLSKVTTASTQITVGILDGKYNIGIEIPVKTVVKVAMTTPPTKTDYIEGNLFNAEGTEFTVYYHDGTFDSLADVGGKYEIVNAITPLTAGENSIVYKISIPKYVYAESYNYTVKVKTKSMTGLALDINKNTAKDTYFEGENFNKTGLAAIASYNNGTTEEISADKLAVSGGETMSADVKSVTVTYGGKSFIYPITVQKIAVNEIVVDKQPAKTDYIEGQKFSATGMVVKAKYNNGDSKEITNYTYSPKDKLTTKDNKISIIYTENQKTVTTELTITVKEKSVSSIQIQNMPVKLEYVAGQQFDPLGMTVLVTYDNDDTAVITADKLTIMDGTDLKEGTTAVTVTYGGKTINCPITVGKKAAISIAVTKAPDKTTYVEGQTFDSSGMQVTVRYSDGSEEIVAKDQIIISGGEQLALGTTAVTVGYVGHEGMTTTCPIKVEQKVATEIVVMKKPDKTEYVKGEKFDATGLLVKQKTNAGTEEEFTGKLQYSQEPLTTVGDSIQFMITAVYEKQASLTFSVTLKVAETAITGIEIVTPPAKTNYVAGQEIDTAGMKVMASYKDNTTMDVTAKCMIDQNQRITVLGQKFFTISFDGKTATQAITVEKKAVSGLSIQPPTKTAYTVGEKFDATGMTVTVHYNDGTSKVITEGYEIQPNGALTAEDRTVTISYTEDGNTVSTKTDIAVKERTLTAIAVTHAPDKTSYIAGESFDPEGMIVEATYDNKETAVISDYTVTPKEVLAVGDVVTISYNGKTATQAITVLEREIKELKVERAPEREVFAADQPFTSNGIILSAVYNDGSTRILNRDEWDCTLDVEGALPQKQSVTDSLLRGTGEKTTIVAATTKEAIYSFGGVAVVRKLTVFSGAPDSVSVRAEAFENQYEENASSIDRSGLVLMANYNGVEVPVTNFDCSDIKWGEDKTGTAEVAYQGVKAEEPVVVQAKTHEHNYQVVNHQDATCTDEGYTDYKCSECGNLIHENIVALGHRYETKVIEPGCTKGGYTLHECTNCDASYMDSITKAANHDCEETVVSATCTENGYTLRKCKNCDFTEMFNETAATGHKWDEGKVTAPTCTEEGYTTYTCAVDRATLKANYVNAAGHDYKTEVVAATCEAAGYTKHTCSRGDDSYNTDPTKALGHDWDEGKVTAPTCTTAGYTLFTCKRCGATEQRNAVAVLGHKFGDWIVTQKPTTVSAGSRYRVCSVCDYKEVESIVKEASGAWKKNDKGWWYEEANGYYYTNTFLTIHGSVFYFNGAGYMVTGWVKVNNAWYFFNPYGDMKTGWMQQGSTWYYLKNTGAMATGWVKVGSAWYFMNASGAMQTGWIMPGGRWYYLTGSGAMATGWAFIDGKWYYLTESGAMQTGWLKLGSTWYFMNGSGAMQTGWIMTGGKWYYLTGSGAMATGWIRPDGRWYYLDGSGAMLTGWQKLGTIWYYMYGNGKMAENTWVGKYYVDASGAWTKTR